MRLHRLRARETAASISASSMQLSHAAMSRLNRARKQLRKQLVDVAGARGIGPRAGQVDEEDLGRSAMARRAGREG